MWMDIDSCPLRRVRVLNLLIHSRSCVYAVHGFDSARLDAMTRDCRAASEGGRRVVGGSGDLAGTLDELAQAADVALRLGVYDHRAAHLAPAVVDRGVVAAAERGANLDE